MFLLWAQAILKIIRVQLLKHTVPPLPPRQRPRPPS